MSIDPGVYLLRHFQSDSVIGVDDGDWDNGEVECWPVKETNTDPDDLVYQRVLIHPNLVQPGTVNLLSLRAGAYLIHNDEEKSKTVRSKSTCAHAVECLWVPVEVERPHGKAIIFKFHPFQDDTKYLGVDDAKDEKSTVTLVTPAEGGKQHKIWWKLEKVDMGKQKIADWMSQVTPQSTKLSMMSIPGTHQSLALNKLKKGAFHSDNPHCQNRSPYLQLCDGMRFFDLRLDYHQYEDESKNARPGLIARHGRNPHAFAWEGYSFSAVCQSVSAFLEDHPGETILIMAKMEGTTEIEPEKWGKIFYDELKPWSDHFHHVDSKGVVDISLEDVRGKAIIFTGLFHGGIEPEGKGPMARFPPPNNNNLSFWKENKHQKFVALEGPPVQLTVTQFPDHGQVMSKHLETAAEDQDPKCFYWLGLNSSGLPGISGAPAGELYNPIDYTRWINKDFLPKHLDESKHPKGTRMGLVTFDFYEMAEKFIKFLVERNPGVEV